MIVSTRPVSFDCIASKRSFKLTLEAVATFCSAFGTGAAFFFEKKSREVVVRIQITVLFAEQNAKPRNFVLDCRKQVYFSDFTFDLSPVGELLIHLDRRHRFPVCFPHCRTLSRDDLSRSGLQSDSPEKDAA